MEENVLNGELRLIKNFTTSGTGQQIVTIDILSNISWSKGTHAVKFGQVIENHVRNIFLKNCAVNGAGRLVLDPFLLFLNFIWDISKCSAP